MCGAFLGLTMPLVTLVFPPKTENATAKKPLDQADGAHRTIHWIEVANLFLNLLFPQGPPTCDAVLEIKIPFIPFYLHTWPLAGQKGTARAIAVRISDLFGSSLEANYNASLLRNRGIDSCTRLGRSAVSID